jgi:CRISPR-associated protein Csh1
MHGRKISRNLFFKRSMDVYKHYYLKGEDRKYACMRTINRIYGFLCECGCLEKRCNVMEEYKDYSELFEKNMEYFDSNEKKAWFILGKAYSTMIYYITPSSNNDGDSETSRKENIKTSLEKNFFFSRKFDFKDFVYFSNLLEEKSLKYSLDKPFFKGMMCEAKEMIGKREADLSQDEAKYLFFWGFNSYFKKDKSVANTVNTEGGHEDGKD